MRILIAVLMMFVTATPSWAQDDDAETRAALAERLIVATVTTTIGKIVDEAVEGMLADQTEVTEDEAEWTRVNMPVIMNRHLQVMIDQVEAHYTERFTAGELLSLVEFYETPQGREIARKQNEVSALMGESLMTFMVGFTEEYLTKYCAEFDCPAGAIETVNPAKN